MVWSNWGPRSDRNWKVGLVAEVAETISFPSGRDYAVRGGGAQFQLQLPGSFYFLGYFAGRRLAAVAE